IISDVQYSANLDDIQVLDALKEIAQDMSLLVKVADAQFGKLEQIADNTFKDIAHSSDRNLDKVKKDFTGIGKGAKVSGAQIGAMSGIVQELTRRFIDIAAQAAP